MAFRLALLPTDGSEASLAAVSTAVEVVGATGEVIALRVIPPFEELLAATAEAGARGRDVAIAKDLAEQALRSQRREAEDDLDRAMEALRAAGASQPRRLVEQGDAGPAIVAAAERLGCDVIVMSTNGRSGWRRALLGSTTDYVIRNSERVPVLLVRQSP